MALPRRSAPASALEVAALRARLADAEATLLAIRHGEVDAVVVTGRRGQQVFTLESADHPYRALIESMNEGALTLMSDQTILFANSCFARMVGCPLEQVIGRSFRQYLSPDDQAGLDPLLRHPAAAGSKLQIELLPRRGGPVPAQLSIRPLARQANRPGCLGFVVTDLTAVRRTEELLRALTQRVVQAQEAERERVARELHDKVTQQLCVVVFRSQFLVERLTGRDRAARHEARKLRLLAGAAAEEVERICRHLRPGVLETLGLLSAAREACTEFARRTGISVDLAGLELANRLPADLELALYRILQEALSNVEHHAHAHTVSVRLLQQKAGVRLTIVDDGIGFDLRCRRSPQGHGHAGLGLLGMRERATCVGGTLTLRSARRAGTSITVRSPYRPDRPVPAVAA